MDAPAVTLLYKITVDGGAETEIDAAIAADDNLLRTALSVAMPELASASIVRHEPVDGVVVIEIKKRAGTKGSFGTPGPAGVLPADYLAACPGGINPALALYQRIGQVDLNHMAPEEGLALDLQLSQALELGEAHEKQMGAAASRLLEARPAKAVCVVLGF